MSIQVSCDFLIHNFYSKTQAHVVPSLCNSDDLVPEGGKKMAGLHNTYQLFLADG